MNKDRNAALIYSEDIQCYLLNYQKCCSVGTSSDNNFYTMET